MIGKIKPVVFAFHGYPALVHKLTYRRRNHANIHVRGFKEEGTTTTLFDMVVLNNLDRYQLALDAILWQRFLRYDPEDPNWPNRDRFVLSNGHASMLLYALLHLAGVKESDGRAAVSLDDIKAFRRLDSRCPGHPEQGRTVGVEMTTGPLGQGCGAAVGMAIAQRWMAQRFNQPEFAVFDYDVYALCGDGDMMEGVTSEAASLAGHLALGNLCWIYDSNHITIEGATDLTFSEDVAARFRAYGWIVTHVADANNNERLTEAFSLFRSVKAAPLLIIINSHIGYGSPHKQDTAAAHGEPLGVEEVRLTKENYGWPPDAQFLVPGGVRDCFDAGMGERGARLRADWLEGFTDFCARQPTLSNSTEVGQRLPTQTKVFSASQRWGPGGASNCGEARK